MKPDILYTKLQRPQVPSDFVPRERLIQLLNQGSKLPITLISAPAGYGKSTLASCWAAEHEYANAWLSLDVSDSDPRSFLTYLVAAIQSLQPDADLRTKTLLQAQSLPPAFELVNHLQNDLHQISEPFCIVLDDFHCIQVGSPITDMMTEMLKHPPRCLHLVVLTRQDPALPVASMRGSGTINEIRVNDLRFTDEEAAAFLGKILNADVDQSIAAQLARETEGWPVALRLAGLYLKGKDHISSKLQKLTGNLTYISEYLIAEVSTQQHPEIVSYLYETSILDRFCAPLCQRIHRTDKPKRGREEKFNAIQFVQWLVDNNLFVIGLDREGYWFRYHHLFRDFIKALLHQQLTVNQIAGLHRSAGSWFAENDLYEEAIRHYLAAGENQIAVRLVIEQRNALLNNAQYHTLSRWMALLPKETVAEEPLLITAQAIICWVSGRREDVIKHTERAEHLLETLSPEHTDYATFQGEVFILHNLRCALSSEPVSAWVDSRKALELVPENSFFFRMMAIAELAFCHQMKGDFNQGINLLKNELKTANLPMSVQARGWFYLTVLNYLNCNTSDTLRSGFKSREIAESQGLAHTLGVSSYFIGATYYLLNELTKAKFHLEEILNNPSSTNVIYVTQACAILGFIYLSEGYREKAESTIERSFDSTWETPDHYSPEIRKALRVELALHQGMVDEARRLSVGVDFDILPPSWFIFVPQLTNIKLLLVDGSAQSLEEARSRLIKMDQKMCQINRKSQRINLLALLALVYHKLNEQAAAAENLQGALDLAEPQGWVRIFVDLGRPMVDLLTIFSQHQTGQTYAKQILEVCQEEQRKGEAAVKDVHSKRFSKSPSQPVITKRETEIITLLAEGHSNKLIAEKLYISPVTVKTHLQNIYKKLNAKNRIEVLRKVSDGLGISENNM